MSGDARPAGGGWMLRAICALGAAAMAAAGAYLFEPALVDLGLYVERGKYALAGYTLIYAALLVGFAATAGVVRTGFASVDFVFSLFTGSLALIGLGAIFAVLAGDALFFRDPANLWVGCLAVPAALCFAASTLSEKAEKVAEQEDTGEDLELDDTAGDSGTKNGLAGIFVWFVTFITVTLVSVMLAIQAAFALFYLLRANLLDGRDIDAAQIGPLLLTLVRNVVAEQWVFAVATAGILGALFLVFLAASALLTRGRPARAINEEEDALLGLFAAQLHVYAKARGYSGDATRILWFVVLPSLFAPMAILLVVALSGSFSGPYDPDALAQLGWHIYEHRLGPSVVVLLFAALLWGVLPNAILSRLSHGYAERAAWSGFATGRQSVEDYLAKLYRAGALSLDLPFDPGAFLRRINTSFEPYFLFPAVPLTLAGAILWHHDISRYYLLTERYVEVMSYWSLERHRYPYSSVQGVILGCTYSKNGREDATYSIVLPDGFTIELFRNGPDNHVADLAKVDAKIGYAAPRSYAVRTPLLRPAESSYDALCVETLASTLPEPEADTFRLIFRAEDWQRQRWEERTAAPK